MASTAWSKLSKIPIQHPFSFGIGVSTIKTSFSDLLVQKVVEQKEQIDWRRNLAFATFGFFYLGGVQYVIYVPFFSRLFPNAATFAAKSLKEKFRDTKGMFSLAAQTFIDQCIHHPFMYFPAFYITKEFVLHSHDTITHDKDNNNDNKAMTTVKNALTQYRQNMKEDLLALWKIWIPATIVNFGFMPMWARIPTVAATSLIWTCILSTMRGGDIVHGEDMAGGSVRGASFSLMKQGWSQFFTSPVDLDPNLAHICVSAAGPDKIGWVALVAAAVADGGGNITHSNMVRLGHDFIILMHVSVKPEQLRHLISSLNSNEELLPLNIRTSFLTKRQTGKYLKPILAVKIHTVGEDRPGMLAAIAAKVGDAQLSVENITTELRINQNGRRDFVINCECTSSRAMDKLELIELEHSFSDLKKDLKLDIVDVRVSMDNTRS